MSSPPDFQVTANSITLFSRSDFEGIESDNTAANIIDQVFEGFNDGEPAVDYALTTEADVQTTVSRFAKPMTKYGGVVAVVNAAKAGESNKFTEATTGRLIRMTKSGVVNSLLFLKSHEDHDSHPVRTARLQTSLSRLVIPKLTIVTAGPLEASQSAAAAYLETLSAEEHEQQPKPSTSTGLTGLPSSRATTQHPRPRPIRVRRSPR